MRLPYAKGKAADGLHYDLLLWANIELGLAILAASAAALRPLLRHIPALFDGTSKHGTHGTQESGPYHELMINTHDTNNTKAGDAETATSPKTHGSTAPAANSSDEELFSSRII